jgi:glutamyl-tRNA synthetase
MLTRLAPSPTGALHLGNARTFLLNWLLARQRGWKILLRIEDLDGPRIKPGADRQAIEDLRWLGLDWDVGPTYQASRTDVYRRLTEQLLEQRLAYPCACTRREIELAASAPHAEDGAAVYPGTCRGRFRSVAAAREAGGREPAIRFRVPPEPVEWVDDLRGPITCDVDRQLGDFVILKNDGTAAYQLAVVADDAEAGVTHVVRGDDLIDSTPRQILLYRALGWADRIPRYFHLPLVVGPDGRRLAKRHGDTRLDYYRKQGLPPARIIALLARWSGMDAGDAATPADLVRRFDLNKLALAPVTFTAADEAWLRAGAPFR